MSGLRYIFPVRRRSFRSHGVMFHPPVSDTTVRRAPPLGPLSWLCQLGRMRVTVSLEVQNDPPLTTQAHMRLSRTRTGRRTGSGSRDVVPEVVSRQRCHPRYPGVI